MGELVKDLKAAYEKSDRKVTGNFGEGLEVVYEPFKATLVGFKYLAGRGKTKDETAGDPTVQEKILQWVKDRGIKPREEGMKLSSLAYLIARKIHREGTDKSKWFKIYEEVITPERISSIIDKVAELNVTQFITTVQSELRILAKGV